jgi:translation initiation factor 2 subunit 1
LLSWSDEVVRKKQALPRENDLVICTITKVFSQGAFASLDEYDGKVGFIHISEIASTWVKNIRDFVKEGQKTVAKVLSVDSKKGHIDLSTRRVGEAQRKNKMWEWKREQKAEKLLEIIAREATHSLEDAYRELGFKLEKKYGGIYDGFEEISFLGEEAIKGLGIGKPWREPLLRIIMENVTVPRVNISGYLDLRSLAPNGVEVIRDALIKAREKGSQEEDVTLDITYVGAPRFRLTVTAPDYKMAEETLRKSAEEALNLIREEGGSGRFLRDIKEEK